MGVRRAAAHRAGGAGEPRADLERERADLAREVAADAIRIAELDRESAVREERARMARDLHDVVAGHLSAVAIHTEATLASADTSRDRDTLRTVRAGALEALAEMRSMILVLRGRPDPVTAPAGLARLDALVGGRAVGRAGGRGRRRTPPAPLPAATDQAAFRIVQESLTNAARHAPGSPVRGRPSAGATGSTSS